MVEAKFQKGSHDFFYKLSFDDAFKKTENIIKRKVDVGVLPEKRLVHRGALSKKEDIIKKLVTKMPESRRRFWMNLPESSTSEDLNDKNITF